jgi:hypothetical protein
MAWSCSQVGSVVVVVETVARSSAATLDAVIGPIVYCALTGASMPRGLVSTLVEDLLRPPSK